MAQQKQISAKQFEGLVLDFLRKNGFPGAMPQCKIPLGAGAKKPHPFDAGIPGKLAVECKTNTWRANGGVPSAKVSNMNEAMYYFHLLPARYAKYFFALKSVNTKGETLLHHYISHHHNLIPGDVRLFEYDPQTGQFSGYAFDMSNGGDTPRISVGKAVLTRSVQ